MGDQERGGREPDRAPHRGGYGEDRGRIGGLARVRWFGLPSEIYARGSGEVLRGMRFVRVRSFNG